MTIQETLTHIIRTLTDDTASFTIAVGGPGGTGKSSLCSQLALLLEDAGVLHLDDYKTPRVVRAAQGIFGAHPDANEMDMIEDHLYHIQRGEVVHKPVYNSAVGYSDADEPFIPMRYTLLDGEVATYEQFRRFVNLSIYIDADLDTQLQTRLTRDIHERGYTHEKAMATFQGSNVDEFLTFGASSKAWADIVLFADASYDLSIQSINDRVRVVLPEIDQDVLEV